MRTITSMFTVDSSKLTDIKTAFKNDGDLYCTDCWVEDGAYAEDIKPLLANKLIQALYKVSL